MQRFHRNTLPETKNLRPDSSGILAGIALIVGGLLGFLPVFGFWMVSLGILVIFFDLPYVRTRRQQFRA